MKRDAFEAIERPSQTLRSRKGGDWLDQTASGTVGPSERGGRTTPRKAKHHHHRPMNPTRLAAMRLIAAAKVTTDMDPVEEDELRQEIREEMQSWSTRHTGKRTGK